MQVGRSLDAGRVIFGSYAVAPGPSKGTLRITSRVLDLKRIRQGPELTELGALEDLAAIETHLSRYCDLVLPISHVDGAKLEALNPGFPLATIPSPVDVDRYRPVASPPSGKEIASVTRMA